MRYISTRGGVSGISFKDAVMMGLADDGGLLLPQSIPHLTPGDIDALGMLDYPELAFQIISRYVSDIPAADLKDLIERSYATFDHPEITPTVNKDGIYILELFHGPTLAFKDVALQFLGNLFEYLLKERGERMNIIGATSGDTGSAAIYGVRSKENINIFILHPHGKVSPVQELQMTTVADDNVFNFAMDGTFDDCQSIVKQIFGDLEFKNKYALGAVNSINWARVLAQIVYYFSAYAQVRAQTNCQQVTFSIPTGNFGDIFAGFIAKRMGLPIRTLILATNENDILTRFVNAGDYSISSVHQTLSPSMDIQLASNLERYLYYLFDEDPRRVREAMATFQAEGRLQFDSATVARIGAELRSASGSSAATVTTIKNFYTATGYTLDPHTAVGVYAGQLLADSDIPLICLATAHPAKFGAAVREAIGRDPELPAVIAALDPTQKRCKKIPADIAVVKTFIAENAC
ncbi:MAG: threonine synthase [Desulfuromonadales bacterium]|nr:threonine synthase [Desulfuromonadales bacterium]MDT8422978.1 threonine synthase [Desulfuromonadales bacterium]